MSEKMMYKTRQREELVQYMSTRRGEHITAGEICKHFKENGKNIGTATVYRQLEKMVDEGLVSKYIIDANSPACFEYIAEDAEHEKEFCFHCKCEKCGVLIHLHCEEIAEFQHHLGEHHGFVLDPLRTVFYGLCSACRQEQGGNGR